MGNLRRPSEHFSTLPTLSSHDLSYISREKKNLVTTIFDSGMSEFQYEIMAEYGHIF